MELRHHVVAVIWTFNPNIGRFARVLESIVQQVNRVIVVDNGSGNIDQIRETCKRFNNIILIELGANLGVHALNIGMSYAVKKLNSEFILLLDDDTIVYPNAVSKILSKIENSGLYETIGVLCMSPEDVAPQQRGKLTTFLKGGQFSGCLVRAEIVKRGVRVRGEFFLDQADFDFYDRIRKLGFMTILYGEKLIDHRIGIRLSTGIKLPLIAKSIDVYEPPWRYYYMVRNSTVLLIEGKLDIVSYIKLLSWFVIPILIVDGILKTFKALMLGIAHGLFRKLGYLDPYSIGLLSNKCRCRVFNDERR